MTFQSLKDIVSGPKWPEEVFQRRVIIRTPAGNLELTNILVLKNSAEILLEGALLEPDGTLPPK